jgi:hypothetical protein
MALDQNYHHLWFVSFRLKATGGHRDPIQLKLRPGQDIPKEVSDVCEERNHDPFSLLTECNKDYLRNYQTGTQFLLKVKLTDRNGGTPFFTAITAGKLLRLSGQRIFRLCFGAPEPPDAQI